MAAEEGGAASAPEVEVESSLVRGWGKVAESDVDVESGGLLKVEVGGTSSKSSQAPQVSGCFGGTFFWAPERQVRRRAAEKTGRGVRGRFLISSLSRSSSSAEWSRKK